MPLYRLGHSDRSPDRYPPSTRFPPGGGYRRVMERLDPAVPEPSSLTPVRVRIGETPPTIEIEVDGETVDITKAVIRLGLYLDADQNRLQLELAADVQGVDWTAAGAEVVLAGAVEITAEEIDAALAGSGWGSGTAGEIVLAHLRDRGMLKPT